MREDRSGRVGGEIRPNFWVKLLAVVLLVIALAVFAIKLMEYNDIIRKQKEVQRKIENYKASIEELEYLLNSPMDADYVARIAKDKLGLYFPDEIIFYNNYKE